MSITATPRRQKYTGIFNTPINWPGQSEPDEEHFAHFTVSVCTIPTSLAVFDIWGQLSLSIINMSGSAPSS